VFAIDATDPTPLYAQLERAIRVGIATGRLRPGEKLPTVRQLAVDLRINANTVAKVYSELERTGVLATRRGVGTFIQDVGRRAASRPDRERQLSALADRFLAGAAALGFPAEEAVALLETRSRDGNQKQEKSDAYSGLPAGGVRCCALA
jgi:GntR family transcriptional regulator